MKQRDRILQVLHAAGDAPVTKAYLLEVSGQSEGAFSQSLWALRRAEYNIVWCKEFGGYRWIA